MFWWEGEARGSPGVTHDGSFPQLQHPGVPWSPRDAARSPGEPISQKGWAMGNCWGKGVLLWAPARFPPLRGLLFHLFVHNNHKSITLLIRTPASGPSIENSVLWKFLVGGAVQPGPSAMRRRVFIKPCVDIVRRTFGSVGEGESRNVLNVFFLVGVPVESSSAFCCFKMRSTTGIWWAGSKRKERFKYRDTLVSVRSEGLTTASSQATRHR